MWRPRQKKQYLDTHQTVVRYYFPLFCISFLDWACSYIHLYIYILHLDWAQTEMFRIAALDDDWPPLCMFMLPVRGPLFRDNRRTQIIIPLESKICFYYRRRVAMLLCTLMLPSDCLFIITAFLLSQRRPGQFLGGAKPFSCLFLSVTSLCIPLKHTHTHTSLGYSLGGAQDAHAVAAGVFAGPGHRHVVVPRRSVTRVPLTAMKRGAGYGIFSPNL